METKLTLKLDKTVIDAAKAYAQIRNKSLSGLVEEFFRNLVTSDGAEKSQISPLVEELSGVISEDDLKNLNYISYLEAKYE